MLKDAQMQPRKPRLARVTAHHAMTLQRAQRPRHGAVPVDLSIGTTPAEIPFRCRLCRWCARAGTREGLERHGGRDLMAARSDSGRRKVSGEFSWKSMRGFGLLFVAPGDSE